MNAIPPYELSRVVATALAEDIREEDVTSQLIPADKEITAYFLVKDEGILAGLDVARESFRQVDPSLVFETMASDGDRVTNRQRVAKVTGNARNILTAERTALNFMQRMSGIATKVDLFMQEVNHTECVILDTRKTVPGLRLIDKWSTRIGGGKNHRIGLYDMVLIKENHIASAGGVAEAVSHIRTYLDGRKVPIEVEVTNLDELKEALPLNVDRIMLDNMSLDDMRTAVELTNGSTDLEASGNVTLQTVKAISETGVNYISSGALTHSVIALDISLEAVL